jgi:hypothetical protein
MRSFLRTCASRLTLAGLCVLLFACTADLWAQTSVRRVQVLGGKDAVEIEVEASERIVPETQVLTGPDRLVVDFPNATPGSALRSQSVFRGQVKDVRVGLFQSKPPITRIVLDLKSAQNYQVFPGRTVIIKIMNDADPSAVASNYAAPARPGLVAANYVTGAEPVHITPVNVKPLEVTYRGGLLSVHSNKATLSEVLYAVQQQTGADIAIAAGAEQERIVVDLGPAPAQEVVAGLLKGSKFNFLIVNSTEDPRKLDRVILSPRAEGTAADAPPPAVTQNDDAAEDEPPVNPAQVVPPATPPQPVQMVPKPQPEVKADDSPEQ